MALFEKIRTRCSINQQPLFISTIDDAGNTLQIEVPIEKQWKVLMEVFNGLTQSALYYKQEFDKL